MLSMNFDTSKADVFAFGVMLREIHGERFESGIHEVMRRAIFLRGNVSGQVKSLIEKCLLDDPNERPSCNEILLTLQEMEFKTLSGR